MWLNYEQSIYSSEHLRILCFIFWLHWLQCFRCGFLFRRRLAPCSLSIALSQISYLVTTLSKSNYGTGITTLALKNYRKFIVVMDQQFQFWKNRLEESIANLEDSINASLDHLQIIQNRDEMIVDYEEIIKYEKCENYTTALNSIRKAKQLLMRVDRHIAPQPSLTNEVASSVSIYHFQNSSVDSILISLR